MFKKKQKKQKKEKKKIDIKYRLIVWMCICVVIIGSLYVTNGIPQFMKDKSVFSLNYDFKPLNIKVKAGDYSIYLNESMLLSSENSVHNFFGNIEMGVYKIVNTVTHIK